MKNKIVYALFLMSLLITYEVKGVDTVDTTTMEERETEQDREVRRNDSNQKKIILGIALAMIVSGTLFAAWCKGLIGGNRTSVTLSDDAHSDDAFLPTAQESDSNHDQQSGTKSDSQFAAPPVWLHTQPSVRRPSAQPVAITPHDLAE